MPTKKPADTLTEKQQKLIDYSGEGNIENIFDLLREGAEELIYVIGKAAAKALENGKLEVLKILNNEGEYHNRFPIIEKHNRAWSA